MLSLQGGIAWLCYAIGWLSCLAMSVLSRPGDCQSWHCELLICTACPAGCHAAQWEQPDFLCRLFNGAIGNKSVSYGEGFFFVSLTIRIQPKILCVLPLRRMSSYTKSTCTGDYFNITNIFELTYWLGSRRAESLARLVLRMKLIMLISTAPLLSPASLY